MTIYGNSRINQPSVIVNGSWSFNQSTERYSIHLSDAETDYELVEIDDSDTCILVKGTLESANLKESWFSVRDDEPPFDPRDYDTGDR
jgi:hypothetical protein